jgi:hypothetical protein
MRCSLLAWVLAAAAMAGCSDEGQPGPATGSTSGSSSVADAGAAGATKKVGEVVCNDDSECETNVCFKGNGQSFCTVRCAMETQTALCVAPLTGTCNKQGYCKRD